MIKIDLRYDVGNMERLHFHFIVAKQDKKYLKDNYKFGYLDVKNIF